MERTGTAVSGLAASHCTPRSPQWHRSQRGSLMQCSRLWPSLTRECRQAPHSNLGTHVYRYVPPPGSA